MITRVPLQQTKQKDADIMYTCSIISFTVLCLYVYFITCRIRCLEKNSWIHLFHNLAPFSPSIEVQGWCCSKHHDANCRLVICVNCLLKIMFWYCQMTRAEYFHWREMKTYFSAKMKGKVSVKTIFLLPCFAHAGIALIACTTDKTKLWLGPSVKWQIQSTFWAPTCVQRFEYVIWLAC